MANKDKAFSLLIPVTMAVLAIAVLWFYWPVLAKLFVNLVESEDYSFGLLLPLVSGYIVYLEVTPDTKLSLAAFLAGTVVHCGLVSAYI